MSTSKTSETYKSLRSDLLNGRFPPGGQLRIEAISKSLQVSVGAVREALSRLTSDGLVRNSPQRGFVVAPVSVDDLRDLTKVRIEIETRCLELAIKQGDLKWEARILSAYHRLSKTKLESGDSNRTISPEWTELHIEFHDSLIAACNSPWRLKLRDMMFLQAERYRRMATPYVFEHRDVDAEHKAIMEATLARDSNLACELLARHFEITLAIVLKSEILSAMEPAQKSREPVEA
jgi:GntR family transcriptional regulator, carbon starvation induced regulator